MSYITKSAFKMLAVIMVMAGCMTFLHKALIPIFMHNAWLNSLILFVILIGVLLTFKQILTLKKEQDWLDALETTHQSLGAGKDLKILTPFSLILEDENLPPYITPLNAKSILSTIEGRLYECREVPRYCIGLLVFLGLIGTFWGLSQTVSGIAGVIGSLDVNGGDAKHAFQTLKQGLSTPISGMGTAFSCSLFGLAGSLIVGFLDLQVGRTATTFYNLIEEQLSKLTRFAPFSSSADNHGGVGGAAFSYSLLEQAIEGMAALHSLLQKSEESRLTMTKSLQLFGEKLSQMSEYIVAHQGFSQKLAQHQIDLQEMLMNQSKDGVRGRNEEIIKTHIRSIDATLNKVLEENIEGRSHTLQELKQEIRFVAKTLSSLANQE